MRSEILLAIVMAATVGCGDARDEAVAASAREGIGSTSQNQMDTADWKAVDEAMGRPGKLQPDGVQKYSLPRSDLKVTTRGVAVKAALALGSWVAFRSSGRKTL